MSPSEREIGEQLGELRSDVRNVAASIGELRRVNSESNANNLTMLRGSKLEVGKGVS